MSPRSSSPARRVKAQNPDPDIYVGLLFVSVASLCAGIIFLILELNKYNWAMPG